MICWNETRVVGPLWGLLRTPENTLDGFELTLFSGERLRFRTSERDEYGADVVADRIRHALARAQQAQGEVPDARLPSRGDRSVRDWLRELRAGAEAPSEPYRATLDSNRLWRVVEDGRGKPLERAAAAVVAVAHDEAGRTRVRVAAGAVARPELRGALESIANGDEDALSEAVDALQATADREVQRRQA